jgi:hypothetical protein
MPSNRPFSFRNPISEPAGRLFDWFHGFLAQFDALFIANYESVIAEKDILNKATTHHVALDHKSCADTRSVDIRSKVN